MRLKQVGLFAIGTTGGLAFTMLCLGLFVFSWPTSIPCFVATAVNAVFTFINVRKYRRDRELGS
jgi:hypothetical protein